MNKDIKKRQGRKNGKSGLRAGTAARFIAIMLTFMMVATWPMMSGSVFAVDDDNPSTVTQDVNGGNTDQVDPQDESGTQDQIDQDTQKEPA